MSFVIEVRSKPGVPDVKGENTQKYIQDHLDIPVDSVDTRTLYFFSDNITPEQAKDFSERLLADRVVQEYRLLGDILVYEQPDIPEDYAGPWTVRVGYKRKPLIRDNWGEATKLAIKLIFGVELDQVRKIDEYELRGNLTREQIERITREEKLADSKVQTCIYLPMEDNND